METDHNISGNEITHGKPIIHLLDEIVPLFIQLPGLNHRYDISRWISSFYFRRKGKTATETYFFSFFPLNHLFSLLASFTLN